MKFRKALAILALIAVPVTLAGCQDDAQVASKNIIKAADNFELNRRIVFYNGRNDSYILTIEGKCSMNLNSAGTAFNVICKTGRNDYKRHTLVLSNDTTAFVEQLEPAKASANHYRVTFKPQQILPDIDFRGDAKDLITNTAK